MGQVEHRRIAKYAHHFFSGTLLSRISGMFRDVSMAAVFGDHPSVAAFMVAFRFSHFLRRLLGEGALQSIFIPHYEELKLKDEQRATAFFSRLTLLLALVLIGIVVLVEGTTGLILHYQWIDQTEVLRLFAWMFPSLIFICLYGLNISLLQCKNSFFASSFAPFLCNATWIAAVFLCAKQEIPAAMVNLAIFIVVGFVIQWLVTFTKTSSVLATGLRAPSESLGSFSQELRTVGKATLFGLVGVAAVQLNSFLDMIFARCADLKGPVYLWYAIRLQQLPLALVGFSCVYSLVPTLSRQIKAQSFEAAQDLYLFGCKRIYCLVIPCTFAIFALGFVSVNLLFGRGQFSQPGVVETTWCLWAYGSSLLPATLTIYQASLFYAYKDFKTPTFASLISVAASIALNALFVFIFHWGAISVAVSTSFSACLNYFLLKTLFKRKGYWRIQEPKESSRWKIAFASFFALLSCMLYDKVSFGAYFYQHDLFISPRAFSEQLLHFAGQLTTFVVSFAFFLFLIYKEMFSLLKNFVAPKAALDE